MTCVEWNASDGAGFYRVPGAVGTQVASNSLVIAGRGGDVIPAPGVRKDRRRPGRAFSALSLFLCRLCTCTGWAKPPIWA